MLDQLAHLETVSRQVEAAMLAILGEAESRGLAILLGYRSMVEVQYAHPTVTRAEAKRRMERALAVASGSFPSAASALETGEIGAAHLDQLIAFNTSLSEAVGPDTWAAAEPELVGAAKAVDPTSSPGHWTVSGVCSPAQRVRDQSAPRDWYFASDRLYDREAASGHGASAKICWRTTATTASF